LAIQFQRRTLALDAFVPVAYTHGIRRRMDDTVLLKSLGYAGRVAWAAILEDPGISRREIAEKQPMRTMMPGRKLSSVRRIPISRK
jgi:hypothetical protein